MNWRDSRKAENGDVKSESRRDAGTLIPICVQEDASRVYRNNYPKKTDRISGFTGYRSGNQPVL
jgi:hypothetical protein